MQTLKCQNFSYLSAGILKVLAQNRITTILDFLQEDVTKISALTKLTLPEILTIRNEIFTKFSAPLVNGTTLYRKLLNTRKVLSTGIERLDALIDGGIPVGYITEICGLADSAKTQLAFQLAINCVKDSENTVLYVDTKGDFSAVRIQKILDQNKCSHKDMAMIMCKIRVVHIWTMDELLELFKSLKNKTLIIENLALIIVDSLPCLMFQYLGDENKIGLSLLNSLVNYSRFICNSFNVGIIYVNIQTRWIDNDISDLEDDGGTISAVKESSIEKRNRCLGRYWEQIPVLVLLLDKCDDNNDNSDCICNIKVSVIDSKSHINNNRQCILNLSAMGVT